MQRIYVLGISGSGKSTFASKISNKICIPHYELDRLYFNKFGEPNDVENFYLELGELIETESWVIEGNLPNTKAMIMKNASTVIILDYRRARILYQLISRQILKSVKGFGNPKAIELLAAARIWWKFLRRLRRFFVTSGKRKLDLTKHIDDKSFAHKETIRFQNPAEAAAWLDSL